MNMAMSPPSERLTTCRKLGERTRLLAARDDLTTPFLSSKTQAQHEGELPQLNGKLYAVAKSLWEKSCPAVANGPVGSVTIKG